MLALNHNSGKMMIIRSFSRFFRSIVVVVSLLILLLTAALPGWWAAPVSAQDQAPRQSPPYDPAQVTAPLAPPIAAVGRTSYLENCAPCHGEQGLGNGPTAVDLPEPATAFADRAAVWELSPSMLFHTTKDGRLEKLMPPWENQLDDAEIWNTVAYAWSLHTKESETRTGAELYAQSCASCHGEGGAGDGPEAEGELPDFTDLTYTTFVSQADWLAGWLEAHAEIGADWSDGQRAATLEYIRTFGYVPPWESPFRSGNGVITGTVIFGAGADTAQQIDDSIVLLEAYMGFEPVAQFTATFSADNTFVFENLSVDPNLVYLASVAAEGLNYSSAMLTLSPERSTTSAAITIYGATDSPEDIRINRAHWILDAQPGALVLAQIYLVGNQGDRTFVGRMVDGVDVPVTVGFDIPADAQELTFQNGALGNRFRRVGNFVYDTMPVTPGDSTQQIIVQYAIPFAGTSYDLRQELLYPVDSLSTLVANFSGLRVDAPEMTFDSIQNIQGSEYQIWRQNDFGPGAVEMKLQGLLERDAVDPRMLSGAASGTTQLAQVGPPMEAWVSWVMMALVVAGLLAVVGVAIQRGAIASTTTNQDLQVLQESLIAKIAEIDDLHALGQIGDTEWLRQRTNLKAQLMDVMRRLDAGK